MRVAVLWTRLSGYLNSCLRALAEIDGVELLVAHQEAGADAPYSDEEFQWLQDRYTFGTTPDFANLLPRLRSFRPELAIVASWHLPGYRAACRELRGRAVRVCCMDNQWEGRSKQWLGVVTAPIFVQRLFDVTFVAGERQAVFARKLGFANDAIWRGLYSCDHSSFDTVYRDRRRKSEPLPRAFLYAGRLSPEKGIDTLVHAYRLYRSQHVEPWPLIVAGEGPLRRELEKTEGVRWMGFVQPQQLPQTFAQAGCFVMPSHWEPWCLAIHEASAAGLPIICTNVCGASVHLVQDGYNGFLTEAGDPHSLAAALHRFADLDTRRREAMSGASHSLSLQFTPERWADYVHGRGTEMLNARRGSRD